MQLFFFVTRTVSCDLALNICIGYCCSILACGHSSTLAYAYISVYQNFSMLACPHVRTGALRLLDAPYHCNGLTKMVQWCKPSFVRSLVFNPLHSSIFYLSCIIVNEQI